MSLKDQLNADLRDAMRGGDDVRKTTLRGLLAAVRAAEDAAVKAKVEASGELSEDAERVTVAFTDDDVLQVIRRQVKQRQDSIEQFQKAKREDLVRKESAELALLQAYLPQMMGRDRIEAIAREVLAETGARGPQDKGKVMPVLMKRLAGQADGREVNAVVTELLGAGR